MYRNINSQDDCHSLIVGKSIDCVAVNHQDLAGTGGTAVVLQNDKIVNIPSQAAALAPLVATWKSIRGHSDGPHSVTELPREHMPINKSNIFLNITRQWLSQEDAPLEENLRAAIAMQSFIQGNLKNDHTLKVALALCEDLRIDGAECMQWCSLSNGENGDCQIGTNSLDLRYQKLPPFINSLTSPDNAAAFAYSYHNGHETFATNGAW